MEELKLDKDLKAYDCVFIGTGTISVLEAIFQDLSGKKVLMLDEQKKLGGAWVPVDLFGYQDVENAIHYFLPDQKGFQFMRDVLQWKVVKSESKFRIFDKAVCGVKRISYDNPLAPVFVDICQGKRNVAILKTLIKELPNIVRLKGRVSTYVEGGSSEMLKKIKKILSKSSVEIQFESKIEDIFICPEQEKVELTVSQEGKKKKIFCKTVYITHGSKINSPRCPQGEVKLVHKIHPRPAVHLLVQDDSPSSVLEAIFNNHALIKYAHDITRFAQAPKVLKGKNKIFVFALQHEVTQYEGIYQDLFNALLSNNIIGADSKLKAHYWSDVFLPSLEDSDLELLKTKFTNQVNTLKTENFARGIGLHAERWSSKIKPLIEGEKL